MNAATGRRTLLLGATALLSGCGFQPVYMRTASGKAGPGQRELQTVFVRIIPERPGQQLRQALQERFGSDSGLPARYDLAVSFGVAGEGIGILNSSLATRIRFTGNASWSLLAHDDHYTPLTSGSARTIDGINIYDGQYFASDMETEAVYQRMADNIAQQITTQLAIWFRQRAAKEAAVQAGKAPG